MVGFGNIFFRAVSVKKPDGLVIITLRKVIKSGQFLFILVGCFRMILQKNKPSFLLHKHPFHNTQFVGFKAINKFFWGYLPISLPGI